MHLFKVSVVNAGEQDISAKVVKFEGGFVLFITDTTLVLAFPAEKVNFVLQVA